MSLVEQLNSTLEIESKKKKPETTNNLENVYKKLIKYKMYSKTEYTLPTKETIGKEYFKQSQYQVAY